MGGSGVISAGIIDDLLRRGHTPIVVSRGNRAVHAGAQTIRVDKSDRRGFVEAMRAVRCDAVIDMISFTASDMRTTIEAFEGRTGHIVVCSSVAAYHRPYKTVPVREDSATLLSDPDCGYPYGFGKAEVERAAMLVWQERKVPVTVIRPSLTFGVGGTNIGVLRQNYGIMERLRRRKPLLLFGDGTQAFSFTFVADLARAFVGILGKPEAFGRAFHAASEQLATWGDLYRTFGQLVGCEPQFAHLPSRYLMEADAQLFGHLYHEKSYDGLFDCGALRTMVAEFQPRITLETGLAEIVAWWESSGAAIDAAKDRLEDALVAVAERTRVETRAVLCGELGAFSN